MKTKAVTFLFVALSVSGCMEDNLNQSSTFNSPQPRKINQEYVDVVRCVDLEFAKIVERQGYNRASLLRGLEKSFDQCDSFVDAYLSKVFERLRVKRGKTTLPPEEIRPTVKAAFKTKFVARTAPLFASVYEVQK